MSEKRFRVVVEMTIRACGETYTRDYLHSEDLDEEEARAVVDRLRGFGMLARMVLA